MLPTDQSSTLSDVEIRAILDQTKQQAFGGGPRAVFRAVLGSIFLVLAVLVSTEATIVSTTVLCGAFFTGIAIYIHWIIKTTR